MVYVTAKSSIPENYKVLAENGWNLDDVFGCPIDLAKNPIYTEDEFFPLVTDRKGRNVFIRSAIKEFSSIEDAGVEIKSLISKDRFDDVRIDEVKRCKR
jgi:hypothetical protein